jgi:hypothetical protein
MKLECLADLKGRLGPPSRAIGLYSRRATRPERLRPRSGPVHFLRRPEGAGVRSRASRVSKKGGARSFTLSRTTRWPCSGPCIAYVEELWTSKCHAAPAERSAPPLIGVAIKVTRIADPLTTKSASPNRPLITPAHYRPANDPSGRSQWPTPYPETNTCACCTNRRRGNSENSQSESGPPAEATLWQPISSAGRTR